MGFVIFEHHARGINFGIEAACTCFLVVLLVAVLIRNDKTREAHYYRMLIWGITLSSLTDVIAFLCSGKPELYVPLAITNAASYCFVIVSFYAALLYLCSLYQTKYQLQVPDALPKAMWAYNILWMVVYVASIWTDWFYIVGKDGSFAVGPYTSIAGIAILPFHLGMIIICIKHWKQATKRETYIYILFSLLYMVFAIVDAVYYGSWHYIVLTIFALLIYVFIEMEQQHELVRKEMELTEKQRELAIKEKELSQSELNALRLQMNPHFIYNTLASIDGLCMFDPDGARDLIAKFTKHLRGSFLNQSSAMISFDKEIENLECYFAVEKVRFPDIEVEYHIEVSDFEVPPFTIQPIFENAIKHGICGRDDSCGKIIISSFEKDDAYHIVIEDDGVGFDVNQKKEPDGRSHLGVENTKKRLELMCGGGLITTSVPGEGTRSEMIIPKR